MSSDNRRELLLRLVEQSREHAFVFADPDGRIVQWSKGAEHVFGYSSQQVVNQPLATLFTPQDQARDISGLELAAAEQSAMSEDDRWQRRADGSQFWATGVLTALRDEQGELLGYIKILRDRTDLREQLDELQRKLEAARAGEAERDVVLATLSHELRNVFSALTHVLHVLSTPDADEAKRRKLVGMMQDQTDLLQRLMDDLLDAQQMKSRKPALALSRITLQELLSDVVTAAQPRFAIKPLSVQLIAPTAPIVVNVDGARLHQVFTNLLDNAIKYTPARGRVWIKAAIEDPSAVVRISDTGAGIPPDMLSRIFDLFTQVDPNGSHKGLGIGLALVRELVELHGGSVQARSEGVGKGSEFTVRLPLAPAVAD